MKTTTRFNLRRVLELNRALLVEGARALLAEETLDEADLDGLRVRLRARADARELGRTG